MCSICPLLTEYVELNLLRINAYNLHLYSVTNTDFASIVHKVHNLV